MNRLERAIQGMDVRLVGIILVIIYGSVILTILVPQIFALVRQNAVTLTGVLAIMASIFVINGLYQQRVKNAIKLVDYDRIITGETHPVLYKRISKDVQILDDDGNATISVMMTCKNTSEQSIFQLIHEAKHDGELNAVSATVNGRESALVTYDRFVLTKIPEDMGKSSLENILKIKFNLAEEKIEPRHTFSYGYSLKYGAVFSNMFKEEGEFSSHHIMHPTELLLIRIQAPPNASFEKSRLNIEIADKHDVRDIREEEKCRKLYYPYFTNNHREILWQVLAPKIASTYRIRFKASSTNS